MDFSDLTFISIQAQKQIVADLETNVDGAAVDVQVGVTQLQGGRRFRSYLLPVGGAIVGGVMGGVVGGPFGALAGLKVGALTAAAAGLYNYQKPDSSYM